MNKFEVDLPDGTVTVEAKDEYEAYQKAIAQSRESARIAKAQQVPETWGDVASQAVRNIPKSAANLVGGLYEAVTSPVQTAKTLLDIGAGALQAALPKSVVDAIGADPNSQQVFEQVGKFYVDRYGSEEGLKKAVAEDPVGVFGDAASVLMGVGGALRGTSAALGATSTTRAAAPVLQRAGELVGAAGSTIDPLAAAGRGISAAASGTGKALAPVLGATTGAGAESIRQAFSAGREGGERAAQFRANIAGNVDQFEVLNAAKQNLENLRLQKSQDYRSGMVNIKNDQTVLGFGGIDNAIAKVENRTAFKGKVVDQAAADALAEARTIIDDWKAADPVQFHTPEGMDALKQSVGAILDRLDPKTNAYNTVNQVYGSIKSEIVKQAPVYANTMRKYSEASDQIREIEKALSLGDKASSDTAMRKLQSLMRDNVNTNFGARVKLGKELEEQGGNLMMPGIAGQALQSIVPRGIQQATAIPTSGVSYLAGGAPAAIASALASSPRLMGEAAFITGVGGRGMDIARKAPYMLDPELYNLLYQSGNVQGLLE